MTKLLTEEGEVLIEQIKQQSGDQENNLKRLHVQEDNKARVRRWKI